MFRSAVSEGRLVFIPLSHREFLKSRFDAIPIRSPDAIRKVWARVLVCRVQFRIWKLLTDAIGINMAFRYLRIIREKKNLHGNDIEAINSNARRREMARLIRLVRRDAARHEK